MVKLVNARKSHFIGENEVHAKQPSLISPQTHGFDYAIVNTYQSQEPLRFTVEQMAVMFSDPAFPVELLTVVNSNLLAAVHLHRLELDPDYAKLFKDEEEAEEDEEEENEIITEEVTEEVKVEVKIVEEVKEEAKPSPKKKAKKEEAPTVEDETVDIDSILGM